MKEKLQRAEAGELRAAAQIYKQKIAEEKRIAREVTKRERDASRKKRAEQVAERQRQRAAEKQAANAAKSLQLY
jgi:hypothetical protein